MKRSAQVALVLMGVGGVTAAGAYMMPARSADCRAPNPPQQQQTAQRIGPEIGGEAPRARAAQDDGCRRRRSSWGTWSWRSSSSYDDRWRSRSQGRPSNSVSTALSPSKGTGTSSSTTSRPSPSTSSRSWSGSSSSTSTTSRGGFGSTSRGFSSSGS